MSVTTQSFVDFIIGLTVDTAPTSDDLIFTVNDPGGTPANRKVTIANLFANVDIIKAATVTATNITGATNMQTTNISASLLTATTVSATNVYATTITGTTVSATNVVGGDPGEGRMFFLPWDYSAIIQGTWVFPYTTGHWFNIFAYNSSNVDGDEINFKAYLAAGTYSIQLAYAKDTAYAISNILIDDTLALTTDHYNAGALNNQLNSATGIIVATSGLKTIKLKVNGRNPSCTNWYVPFCSFSIWRTA